MMINKHSFAQTDRPKLAAMKFNVFPRFAAALFVMFAIFVADTIPVRGDVDAAAVQRAIDRGVAYLRKTQTERGGWDEFSGYSCGQTALCTLAMLNCGVEKDDPSIARAMKYLRSFEPVETYSVSLQTLVYCHLGAAGDLPRIRRNVQWLVDQQFREGSRPEAIGAWNYGKSRGGSTDPSNSQFAILALGAAEERGIQVEPVAFELALKYWIGRQRNGGAWSYGSRDASGSMTCAGISSIIIARGRLGGGTSSIAGNVIQCCGGQSENVDPVEAGLEWLGRNFTTQVNPGGNLMTFYYYMYALERVGRLSGRRFIGDHDWYREGAQRLIELQDGFLGYWKNSGPLEPEAVATSFALLFLSKGKRQVVVGRLRYPRNARGDSATSTHWKQHPDGMRQLVRHVESDWGRDLTWQTIDSEKAGLADLLQTPVLVISGNQPLVLADQTSENLREYIDQGGTILFEADTGAGCPDASGFQRSVVQLCSQWFDGAALDRLPPEHPVWFAEKKVDATALGPDFWMYGVQACCRTSVFYSPTSLSCRWELGDAIFRRSKIANGPKSQIETAIGIGENVIAYATGRELKDKLQQSFVIDGASAIDARRSTISIATLGLDAGGQEARRAVPNAAALVQSRVPLAIAPVVDPVGFDADTLADVQFLWVHGRTDFSLSDAHRNVLRQFVQRDGIILGSAVCGGEAFTEAFRREVALMFPDSPLRPIPEGHPLLTASGGYDISSVMIRTPAVGGRGSRNQGVGKRAGRPLIEVAVVDNVAGVFFSPLDLSCALESPNSVQCPGYSTEDAAKIVANMMLFGLQQ
ncbi:hypothetical protein Poly51_13800 [Rubripirellula tenax]|uniref:DUF4159 domain-containing protein n=1 Tax=Rubripirellula tenax TaxID=2528015 RepID=A0A5C6FG81_9BACT|nr:DUF4159 domain-containing protein [Rubripirellula tenax]TWU58601.1 hypothetical protein Poly51_13800 [Rubripirellula tenax]